MNLLPFRINRVSTLLCLALIVPVPSLTADTLTMRDGKVYEGVILEETVDSVRMQVQNSDATAVEQTFAKSDVKSMQRVPEDEMAFKGLDNFGEVPPVSVSAEYSRRIRALEDFATRFPESESVSKAQEMMATLRSEKEKVDSGWLKLGADDGDWVSPAQYEQEPVRYRRLWDATLLSQKMKAAAKQENYIEALQSFEILEREYQLTDVYVESISDAQKLLRSLLPIIEKSVSEQPVMRSDWEAHLANLSDVQREEARRTFESERIGLAERRRAEIDSGAKWPVYDEWDTTSLQVTRRKIESESARLGELNLKAMSLAIGQIAESRRELENGNVAAAAELLKLGGSAYPDHPEVQSLLLETRERGAQVEQGGGELAPSPSGAQAPNEIQSPSAGADEPDEPLDGEPVSASVTVTGGDPLTPIEILESPIAAVDPKPDPSVHSAFDLEIAPAPASAPRSSDPDQGAEPAVAAPVSAPSNFPQIALVISGLLFVGTLIALAFFKTRSPKNIDA